MAFAVPDGIRVPGGPLAAPAEGGIYRYISATIIESRVANGMDPLAGSKYRTGTGSQVV